MNGGVWEAATNSAGGGTSRQKYLMQWQTCGAIQFKLSKANSKGQKTSTHEQKEGNIAFFHAHRRKTREKTEKPKGKSRVE